MKSAVNSFGMEPKSETGGKASSPIDGREHLGHNREAKISHSKTRKVDPLWTYMERWEPPAPGGRHCTPCFRRG